MKQQRLIWADSLKGWLMLLVVLGHAIQRVMLDECTTDHVWNIIYSFHMPAFMTVSGYFAYHKIPSIGRFVKRRFNQLMVPYLLWSLIAFMLSGIYTLRGFWSIFVTPDSFFWFLWVLFWISILFVLIQKTASLFRIDEIVPIIACCIILIGIMVLGDFRKYGFQFISYYFLFYTLGYAIRRFHIVLTNKVIISLLFALWAMMAWYWNMHELPTWMPSIPFLPSTLVQFLYRGITAVIAIIVLFGISPYILNSTKRINLFMSNTGKLSLGLYVVHIIIIGYVARIMKQVFLNLNVSLQIVLLFVVAYLFAISVVFLLAKNKWSSRVLLGKL